MSWRDRRDRRIYPLAGQQWRRKLDGWVVIVQSVTWRGIHLKWQNGRTSLVKNEWNLYRRYEYVPSPGPMATSMAYEPGVGMAEVST